MRDPTHFGGVWKPRSGVSGCAARDGAAGSADRGRACYGTSPARGASNFGWSLRTNYCRGCFDILAALKKGRGFLRSLVWFQPEHFRRVPVSSIGLTAPHLRRLHTSGLPDPRSCDKRTIHQNLRLISPLSRTEPYGASAKRNAKAAKERALTFAFYSPIVGAVEETGDGPASCRTGGGVSPSAFKGQRVKRQPA